jgi:hypothetical protein
MAGDAEQQLVEITPRVEAGLLSYAQLTEGQREAAQRACSIFSALADASPENMAQSEAIERALAHVEVSRRNPVILIDGGRGSGKTALMLTLLQQWKIALLRQPQYDPQWAQHIQSSGCIVPLHVIDLGSLSSSSSLVLHIASRLQRLVEVMEPLPQYIDRERPAPWAPYVEGQLESRKAWGPFLRAAALGWDGNLKDRQARIDPETFVAELDWSEQGRLDVLPAFRAFTDALVKDFARWGKREGFLQAEPLFVIPVDDADMNPDRVVELLQLANLLRHPRIAFLMAGDSILFLSVLKVHFAGVIRAPAPKIDLSADELIRLGVQEQILRLARLYYDKVVPPHHRCEILPLSAHERVSRLLDKKDYKVEGQEESPPMDAAVKQLFERQPHGKLALPGRMRALLDLKRWLQDLSERSREERLAELVVHLWEDAINEEPILTPEEAERMRRTVSLADPSVRRLIEGVPLEARTPLFSLYRQHWPLRQPRPVETLPPPRADLFTARLYLESFDMELRGYISHPDTPGNPSLGRQLSARTVAAWTLVRQLIPEVPGFDAPPTGSVNLVGVEFGLKRPARTVRVPWPLPSWSQDTGRLENLHSQWLAYLTDDRKWAAMATVTVADYAQGFLSCVLRVIDHETDATTWDEIATTIVRLGNDVKTDPIGRQWVNELAILLAAPESGMDEQKATTYLKALETAGQESQWWQNQRPIWPGARSERLGAAVESASPGSRVDLSAIMKEAWPDHQWYQKVEADSVS